MKAKVILMSLLLLFVYFLFVPCSLVEASEEREMDLAEKYTQDDNFKFQGEQYTIQDYAEAIEKNKTLNGANVVVESDNEGIIARYTIKGDDPIIEIIPRNYFEQEGTQLYIGNEYGFFIETTKEKYYYFPNPSSPSGELKESKNMRSTIIVFDIDNKVDLKENIDQAIFKVEVLFQLQFVLVKSESQKIYRIGKYSENYYDDLLYQKSANCSFENNNQDDYVVPLYDCDGKAKLSKYYISDISFGATLANEQDYNVEDKEYIPKEDKGSFFTRMDYIYDGLYLEKGKITDSTWKDIGTKLLTSIMSEIIGKTPVINTIGKLFSISSEMININSQIEGVITDNLTGIDNKNYISNIRYQNGEDQIGYYGKLTKTACMAFNSSKEFSILYGAGNSAEIQYTINDNRDKDTLPNHTRITNEIALKVVRIMDENIEVKAVNSGSHHYMLREPVEKELMVNSYNLLYLQNNGRNYFYFEPTYSGKYEIKIENLNQEIKMQFNGNSQIGTSIQTQLNKGQRYSLIIDNLSNEKIIQHFVLDICLQDEEISVLPNNQHIVKIKTNNEFKRISFSNPNAKLLLLDDKLNILKESNAPILHYFTKEQPYYVVICNDTLQNIEGIIHIENINDSVNEGSIIELNLNYGSSFYKFTPTSTKEYSFLIAKEFSGYLRFVIYEESGKNIFSVTQDTANYINYSCRLSKNVTYYIGYENSIIENKKIDFIINSNDLYQWYVNDELLTTRTLHLKQGECFSIYVKFGNTIIYPDIKIDGITPSNGEWCVDESARLLIAEPKQIFLQYTDSEGDYLYFIDVYIYPNIELEIDTSNNHQTNERNKFIWDNSDGHYIGLTGKFKLENGEEYTFFKNINSDKKTGSIEVPNMIYSMDLLYTDIYIETLTYEQKYIKDGVEIITSYTLSNSYPYESRFEDRQFYFEPITNINLMFSGGKGTSWDPFQITNEHQLNNIRYCTTKYREGDNEYDYIQQHFVIMNNIELHERWRPIDNLMMGGSIKGYNNHQMTIGNMKITESKTSIDVGFIRNISHSTIAYLKFIAIDIQIDNTSNNDLICIGAIVGSSQNSFIENCYADGEIIVGTKSSSSGGAKYTHTGGICGMASSVTNCESHVNIESYGNIGGVVGYCWQKITNCTYSGNITLHHDNKELKKDSENRSVGGIVGILIGGTIKQCEVYNTKFIYKSSKQYKDKILAPRIGFIIGRFEYSNLEDENDNKNSNITIDSNKLCIFKAGGFLGIGQKEYNQKRYTNKKIGQGIKI